MTHKKITILVVLLIFTIVSAYRYIIGDVSDCGCFGKIIERKNDWVLIVENSFVMILLSIIFITSKKGSVK